MYNSVFVRQSIKGLVHEGVTWGFFCVLVILLLRGQWKMTAIAGMTLPLSVLVSLMCLYGTGNTINVMTLAGLTLAIGPMDRDMVAAPMVGDPDLDFTAMMTPDPASLR